MYLITGATGNVGSHLAKELRTRGMPVRVFVRNPATYSPTETGIAIAQGEFADLKSFARAVQGVRGVFLINRGLDEHVFAQMLEIAKAASVTQVVLLSTLLAGVPGSPVGELHLRLENAIRASGMRGDFIRPGAFMSNVRQWIPTIKKEGVVLNPMGTGKTAPVAPEDLAAIGAQLFQSPPKDEQVLEVTGGELMSVPEQVEVLSSVLKRPLRTVDITIEQAVEGMVKSGIPKPMAEAVGVSFRQIREGRSPGVLDTLPQFLRRKPKTFREWAEAHAAEFN